MLTFTTQTASNQERMRKYVFIDFDGVLNTERHHSELVSSGQKCSDQYGPLFDPVAVGNLKRIVDETEAGIVIISSWKLEGVDRMMNLWKTRRMPGVLAGCTPDCISGMDLLNVNLEDPAAYANLAGKGNEVKQWLKENAPKKADGYRYVILDDVPDFLPEQEENYIQISPVVGITAGDTEKAIEILKQ